MSKKIFEPFLDQEIRVEQKHIDKGETCHCHRCPVALALLEQVPDCEYVSAQEDRLNILFGIDGRKAVETPSEAAKAMDEFDRTGKMRPFTFRLTIAQ